LLGKRIKIIAGVFALASVISYFLITTNEKQFDKTQWHASPLTRYKMSKDIIASNMLINNTKEEVVLLLGNPEISKLQGKEHLIYKLGKPPSFFEENSAKLVLIFENDLVIKVIHSHE